MVVCIRLDLRRNQPTGRTGFQGGIVIVAKRNIAFGRGRSIGRISRMRDSPCTAFFLYRLPFLRRESLVGIEVFHQEIGRINLHFHFLLVVDIVFILRHGNLHRVGSCGGKSVRNLCGIHIGRIEGYSRHADRSSIDGKIDRHRSFLVNPVFNQGP